MIYEEIQINNITVYIARVRRSKSIKISFHSDGKLYLTHPWYISKKAAIDFLQTKKDWIEKYSKRVNTREARISLKELKEQVTLYANTYIPLMGITVKRISFRKMTTRWGSCTSINKTIRFSTELTKCSDRFIEAVVVHELAHLIEPNHSKKFWDIVKTYIPDVKKIKPFE